MGGAAGLDGLLYLSCFIFVFAPLSVLLSAHFAAIISDRLNPDSNTYPRRSIAAAFPLALGFLGINSLSLIMYVVAELTERRPIENPHADYPIAIAIAAGAVSLLLPILWARLRLKYDRARIVAFAVVFALLCVAMLGISFGLVLALASVRSDWIIYVPVFALALGLIYLFWRIGAR